ncbi:MAG: hypothetical protein C0618_09295 [Desulfuromonas sp.]|nr:MAG: hypothetical protein C0618_09295 [Desulfuromonas sp.]
MKKETVLALVVVLVVGVLIGVIVSNMRQETSTAVTTGNPAAAPPVDFQQKIVMLERIVSQEPDNLNAWVQLGHNYFDSDQPAKAVTAYDKALALGGDDPNLLTDQGVMYRRLGQFDKAIANFEAANRLNPRHHQSLYNLGIVFLYDKKDPARGLEVWKKYLMIAPPGPGTAQVQAEVQALEAMHSQGKIQ